MRILRLHNFAKFGYFSSRNNRSFKQFTTEGIFSQIFDDLEWLNYWLDPKWLAGWNDGHGDGREGREGQEGKGHPSFVNRSSSLIRCLASAWLAALTKCLASLVDFRVTATFAWSHSQVTSDKSSNSNSSSSSSDVEVKLMMFGAVNVRCVMHSSLSRDDVERAIEKVQLVLHQLCDWIAFFCIYSCTPKVVAYCYSDRVRCVSAR